ncbi:MAG: TetR/AcrR family transcriptional regulator [Myxococcota bacterium]
MGSIERRQREREEMRGLIARTAMKLFLSEGFEKTSMRRIAEAIEYTPGALYGYFKDKDEILYAIHTEGMDRLYEAMKPAESVRDPAEALRVCCQSYVKFALSNREYYDLMFIMDATGNKIKEKEDWREGLRTYDVLRRCVYRAMEAGMMMPGNPEAAAFMMWSTVHGMMALLIRNRCAMFDDAALPAMIEGTSQYMMESQRLAAISADRPQAPLRLPDFVPFSGLKPEGIQHVRALPKGGRAKPTPKTPRKKTKNKGA